LVYGQRDIGPPNYLKHGAKVDISAIVRSNKESYDNTDILRHWPSGSETGLDEAQHEALRRILTKKLAIIQGPPGTGKTYISLEALKVLLSNMLPGDPPIIVTCQTNHALDQLLRKLAEFEPAFIRLGGRSKDKDVVKKRTLYEVRKSDPQPQTGVMRAPAVKRMRHLQERIKELLSPMETSKGVFDHNLFKQLGLLTDDWCKHLEEGDTEWEHRHSDADGVTPMELWLKGCVVQVDRPSGDQTEDRLGEFEEADLEYEQLQELEAENVAKDDDEDFDKLNGPVIYIAENVEGKGSNETVDDEQIKKYLRSTNPWKVRKAHRGLVYKHLHSLAKRKLTDKVREIASQYDKLAVQRRMGNWELDLVYLKQQKVVGMTTTGFSKYRTVVSSLRPKIVLIEEAAESLEGPVTATCIASLEHLILVGDHQQLRPHTHVRELEGDPYNLDMSLFERLVKNEVEFHSLREQRRMAPEIRRLLKPIYGDLITDHHSVTDLQIRPHVPGMGGCNSYFFTHEWPEVRDEHMSACNPDEARMIVNFCDYLVLNGMEAANITVLTFYNGQRKLILKRLREHPHFVGSTFKVVTVDSYQGEENDVVLLSLVRSNYEGKMGFLSVINRVCVALSRARRGFYLFGNAELLCRGSRIWAEVIKIMAGQLTSQKGNVSEAPSVGPVSRIGYHLHLECQNHNRKTFVNGK
jgi:helicase required for RNAi-mediated heterochromatin assembly 1